VIGDKWNAYLELLAKDMSEGDALDELHLKRYWSPARRRFGLVGRLYSTTYKASFTGGSSLLSESI
jgi:DNA-directed RNA polymerase subunit N (RpoN/RPB10)